MNHFFLVLWNKIVENTLWFQFQILKVINNFCKYCRNVEITMYVEILYVMLCRNYVCYVMLCMLYYVEITVTWKCQAQDNIEI